jgi:anti-sigma B factor antagonist
LGVKSSTIENNIGLIEPSGSLIGGEETDQLRRSVLDFASRNYDKLLIDLTSVTYMNSTAIGVLVASHATYSKRNWQIKLCGINKNIDSIFVVTKLALAFDVYDTRDEAVKSFK